MSRILPPQMKLPFRVCCGSVAERQRKTDHMVNKLYQNLCGGFKNGEMPISKVQEEIDKLLPQNCKVIVRSGYDKDFVAFNDTLYSEKTGRIKCMTLELNAPKNKIKEANLIDVMHEFTHIADSLFNPKYLGLNHYMTNSGRYTVKYSNLYDNHLYVEEFPESKADRRRIIKELEYKIRKFLRKMSPEDKLLYIQDARYSLQAEDLAYSSQYKFAKKMKKKRLDVSVDDLHKWNDTFMFAEKIDLLKRLGFEIIRKERDMHAKRLKAKAVKPKTKSA